MLVQTLIGIVVVGMAMAAITMVSANQSMENKALSEKLGSIEVQRQLLAAVSDPDICSSMLVSQLGATTLDLTNPRTTQIGIQTLSPTGARAAVAQVGENASDISSSLLVQNIRLKNFVATGSADKYISDLVIEYDPTTLTRPITSPTAKVILLTTGAVGAKTVVSCVKPLSAGGVSWPSPIGQNNCSWFQSCNSAADCPAGQYIAGIRTGLQSFSAWAATICSQLYCCSP